MKAVGESQEKGATEWMVIYMTLQGGKGVAGVAGEQEEGMHVQTDRGHR